MDMYTKYVMNLPNLGASERIYLIAAYDASNEDFYYPESSIKHYFTRSTMQRIRQNLLRNQHIRFIDKPKNHKLGIYELNYNPKKFY